MQNLTAIYKLLGDETRLRILMLLSQGELCVCQLSGIIDAPQSRISKNLSKLRDLNLVSDLRRDKFVYYSLKEDNSLLGATLRHIDDHIAAYPTLVKDRAMLEKRDSFLNSCGDLGPITEGECCPL